jgi:hypothetical protein
MMTKKSLLTKISLYILGVLLILAVPVYMFWEVISLQYYNLRVNHAKMNGKLYEAEWMSKSHHKFAVQLYRSAEPINSIGKKMIVEGGWQINGDSLVKHHSDFVGYYKGFKISDSEFGYKMPYYIISPNQLGIVRIYYESEIQLPKGYKFTNEPFYVLAYEISTDERPK